MKRTATILALCCMVLGLSMTGPERAAAQAALGPGLSEALASLGQNESLTVVVTFHGEGVASQHLQLLESIGVARGVYFQALPIAGVSATRGQIEALATSEQVRSIWPNDEVVYENDGSTALTGVDRARTEPRFMAQNGGFPVSGRGVTVLVNDSGIDGNHLDHQFGRNLVQNTTGATNLHAVSTLLPVTYTEGLPDTDIGGGHGTHVAGTVGGTGARSNGKYEGVAPGASLVGYGSGLAIALLDVAGGLDYALVNQLRYGIRVVTNSWGTPSDSGTDFNPDHPLNVATKKLYDRGVVVIFSAGNSGAAPHTITGNYKKAPWVICVAAGDKNGRLASFSSRGLENRGGSVEVNGRTFTWEDRPTITAPGVLTISTKAATSSLVALSAPDDLDMIDPAFLPFYTTMSGTSMAAPHIAGVVALLLEANPTLSPDDVKRIIQETATNIPGREAWEVGAGYVNAYAAVANAMELRTDFGATTNYTRSFNSSARTATEDQSFTVDYDPILTAGNSYDFNVPSDALSLLARVNVYGFVLTGNTINLVLIAPDGTEYSSGVNVLFTLYTDRSVVVDGPQPGTWRAELRGLRGDALNPIGVALPERVNGLIRISREAGFDGLNDIAGHPAEASIKMAVANRLVDGFNDKNFRPDQKLRRVHLADYLVMGAGVRQFLPLDGSSTFGDVGASARPFAEAVAARGAALRDIRQQYRGVMLPKDGSFRPNDFVTRAELAYSLVQSLGLEAEALARSSSNITVQYNQQRVAVTDAGQVPEAYRGYVQLALDLNILNAYFSVTQGPFDLQPKVTAEFRPNEQLTRGGYAVAISRFFGSYLDGYTLPPANGGSQESMIAGLSEGFEEAVETPASFALEQNYPNPFNPTTTIRFRIPEEMHVQVAVYNVNGQRVRTLVNETRAAGSHEVTFTGRGEAGEVLASGIYLYRIDAGSFSEVRKMLMVK